MRWRKYFWLIMLPVQIVALQVLSFFPEAVERYYSRGVYPIISGVSRAVTDFVPFSVGDILYGIVIGYFVYRVWKHRRKLRSRWQENLWYVLSAVSIFYFFFNVLWGINYHRVPLSEKLQIDEEYSVDELLSFTRGLVHTTNVLHQQIAGNDSLKVIMPYSQEQVFQMNTAGYRNLAERFPQFCHDGKSVKKSLISLPLTYMGFSGYLNPFTNEAQVNYLLPDYSFPATAAHEMAHQIGYASESEANFVGYLATISNDDPYIQYSGYCLALRYCMAELEYRDEKLFDDVRKTINPGILENFRESREFWERYETFIENGFHLFWDRFLKINQQEEGMESYSRFVDLLVNYSKVEKG